MDLKQPLHDIAFMGFNEVQIARLEEIGASHYNVMSKITKGCTPGETVMELSNFYVEKQNLSIKMWKDFKRRLGEQHDRGTT